MEDTYSEYLPNTSFSFNLHIEDNFLNDNECKNLTNYLLNHKLFSPLQINDNCHYCFNSNIIFNKDSKHEFINSKFELRPIYEIFERIKHDETNAYAFNPLIIKMKKNTKIDSVRYHYDDTISSKVVSCKGYLPVYTTIIYVSVPETLIGGDLRILDHGADPDDTNYTVITPKRGRKVTMRGDSFHGISSMITQDEDYRISLAFEEYIIPENFVHDIKFEVSSLNL